MSICPSVQHHDRQLVDTERESRAVHPGLRTEATHLEVLKPEIRLPAAQSPLSQFLKVLRPSVLKSLEGRAHVLKYFSPSASSQLEPRLFQAKTGSSDFSCVEGEAAASDLWV